MNLRSALRDIDLDAIREATREAEDLTGGELVCVIVGRCDEYPAATWRGAALGALAGVTVDAVVAAFSRGWTPAPAGWHIAVVLLGMVVGGMLATWVPQLARLLIDRELLERRVARRAVQAFVDEQVFETVDRSGVLLLVAVFERRVQILADKGIASLVDESAWAGVVEDLEAGLRTRRRGEVLLRAVRDLGDILANHKVPRRVDDRNELSDEPRVHDR